MATSQPYLHVFVTNRYKGDDGKEKTNYVKIGAAFPNKVGGFGIDIMEGLALTGKAVALPPRDFDDGED